MTDLLTVGAGVVVGVTSALFGVGGGLIMVPFGILALDLTQQVAEGTSLLVIVPTALLGAFIHHRNGLVRWYATVWIAAGGVAGAYVGARVGLAVEAEALQRAFAVVVAATGVRLIIEGIRTRPSATGRGRDPFRLS